MHARWLAFLAPLACSSAAAACARSEPPPASAAGVTNAQPVDDTAAAALIASAQCQHATACGEIGDGQPDIDANACFARNRGEAESVLRQDNCPNGVDSTHLQVCESAILAEECAGIVNEFNRRLACRTEALCP